MIFGCAAVLLHRDIDVDLVRDLNGGALKHRTRLITCIPNVSDSLSLRGIVSTSGSLEKIKFYEVNTDLFFFT